MSSSLPRRAAVPRELLVPATPSGLLRLAAVEWTGMALGWAVMAWAPPVLVPLAVLVVAGRLHALGVLLHDAVHLPSRRREWRLCLLETVTGYPIASTLEAMRYHHLRHHRDAGLPSDPYRKPPDGGRLRTAWRWLLLLTVIPGWVLRGPVGLCAWMLPSLRTAYGRVFLQDRSGRVLTRDAEVAACARAEAGQVLFHLGVLALAVRWPSAVLWGYAVPLLVASGFNAHRLLAEHTAAPVQGRKLEDVFACTRDHGLGWWGGLGLAPRHVGMHVVHHLHPQVSFTHLPRLRAWYVERFPHHYPRPRSY
ncbi:fatty acid desaturase [Corallococcus sp. CA041A]|uniref:fatty acid desaturase family protein n=1 Tax=Corallococcus sp. CA041A TaxID=2316727 RepID=UPI0013153F24|nr:fatty acid desaturase [Corallococcus sp. CA041A]